MQCRICQYELGQNVTLCPNCGAQDAPSNPGIAPTVLASSPNQEIPPAYPTPPAPAPSAYSTPPPTYAPYPPATSYGASAPPPPTNAYQPYGEPQAPYGMPPQGQYNAAPMPMYAQQPQPPKSNRGCIIAVVVVLSLLVLIVGGIAAAGAIVYNTSHNAVNALSTQSASAQATFSSDLTAVPTVPPIGNNNAPDPSQIDANAATMVLSAQSSSGIDNNDLPTDSKAAFAVGDTVYVTFKTAGNTGYVMSKWFQNGEDVADSTPVADTSGQTAGYFSHSFLGSGDSVVGIYWCTQSDCSDAALAQVVNVTVS